MTDQQTPETTKTPAFYEELARRAVQAALNGMDDTDVSGELSLACAAWDAVMGIASPTVLEDLSEYELIDNGYQLTPPPCTCPPDLVARGGFRSGCPQHALVSR